MSYSPSEILAIFDSHIAAHSVNRSIVEITGLYRQKKGQAYNHYFYDSLSDEHGSRTITIRVPEDIRIRLNPGNLVTLRGCMERFISDDGRINLQLVVSSANIEQQQVVDENETRRMEAWRSKRDIGFKRVDEILEGILMENERQPRVCLLFAENSITLADFRAGAGQAVAAIEFIESRVNFNNPRSLMTRLMELDGQGYDSIAIVRGGGAGIEHLDEPDVIEIISYLQTPIIGAIGHVEERLFIKQMVDKNISTPNGLGQYFSEMVERVTQHREQSIERIAARYQRELAQKNEQLAANTRDRQALVNQINQLTATNQQTTQQLHTRIDEQQRTINGLHTQLSAATQKGDNAALWKYVAIISIIIAIVAFIF